MPQRESEAIVLRTYRLGEADKIVSLFTRQMGRIRAVAAGAQRPKSRYGGSLESLSYIRLWVFERENRDLGRLNNVELLESFFSMQSDYRRNVAAQYVAEVAEQFLPEREVNERVFRLVLAVLRAMKQSGEVERPLLYWNYWLLRLGGFLPEFSRCSICGRGIEAQSAWHVSGEAGLFCRDCRPQGANGTISGEALALTTLARQTPLDRWIATAPNPPAGTREGRRFLEELIASHVEKKLRTRELLAENM
jgi:DNA repair protein RecO (recombination protein O)